MSAHEPVSSDPVGTASEARSLAERITPLGERLHLGDVQIRRLAGEVFVRPPLTVAKIGFRVAAPDIMIKQSHFACRFTERVVLLNDAGQHLALIEVVCVLEFRIDDGLEPDPEELSAYAGHEGYYVAYPHINKSIQAIASKLELDPVLRGLLNRNWGLPSEITVRR